MEYALRVTSKLTILRAHDTTLGSCFISVTGKIVKYNVLNNFAHISAKLTTTHLRLIIAFVEVEIIK